jgi:hypothetical protein
MKAFRTFGALAAGLAIFAGFIAVTFAAQGPAVSQTATAETSRAPKASEGEAMAAAATIPVAAIDVDNGCEKQNWPYYSKNCLRGDPDGSIPRQVNLQQSSVAPTEPAPINLASASIGSRPTAISPVTDQRHRQKIRHVARTANRPSVAVRPSLPASDGFEQPVAFTW